jgi:hypothetical protein
MWLFKQYLTDNLEILEVICFFIFDLFNDAYNSSNPVKKTELTARGIRCADHATPSIRKSWH